MSTSPLSASKTVDSQVQSLVQGEDKELEERSALIASLKRALGDDDNAENDSGMVQSTGFAANPAAKRVKEDVYVSEQAAKDLVGKEISAVGDCGRAIIGAGAWGAVVRARRAISRRLGR